MHSAFPVHDFCDARGVDSAESVIGRPTRRGPTSIRVDDDDMSQSSSASVIGRPTHRGPSPVPIDDDRDFGRRFREIRKVALRG